MTVVFPWWFGEEEHDSISLCQLLLINSLLTWNSSWNSVVLSQTKEPSAPLHCRLVHPQLLLLSPSLTHLPKVDKLTPSAGAVHFPEGATAPHTPAASISCSHVPRCGPLQTLWAVPQTIPSEGVINACLLREGRTISTDGVGGGGGGGGGVKKRKAKERRRWREGVADAEVGDCGSRLGRSSEPTIITSS